MDRFDPTIEEYDGDMSPEMRKCSYGDYVRYDDLPKIHNLKINPEDLPDDDREVLCVNLVRNKYITYKAYYYEDAWFFYTGEDLIQLYNVIAWQELPSWGDIQ